MYSDLHTLATLCLNTLFDISGLPGVKFGCGYLLLVCLLISFLFIVLLRKEILNEPI